MPAGDDQEKTEEPTPKKIEDAQKEGNVPKSQDLSGFIGMFIAFLTYLALFDFLKARISQLFIHITTFYGTEFTREILFNLSIKIFIEVAIILLPLAIPLMIAGIIGNLIQFGFIFTTKPLIPDIKKIDPIKGMQNLFSMKKLIEGIKITFKVLVSFAIGFIFFLMFIKELPTVAMFPLFDQIDWLHQKAIVLIGVMLIVMLVFGVVDFIIKKLQYTKDLRMSKQEIKDEYKNMEGDPLIKGKIRQIQMEMARKRMMQEVPTADVVVTNPTHYAVAIRYDQKRDKAPIVVAKGTDKVAIKIKEIAREHNIQIYESPPLARELYKIVDINQEIPEHLYKVVAEILVYVYKTNNKKF